jgi:hypothetical protein
VIQADGTIAGNWVIQGVQAYCSAGKRVLGGGCKVEHANGLTWAIDGYPLSGGYSCDFMTTGLNEPIHAYAICGVVQ